MLNGSVGWFPSIKMGWLKDKHWFSFRWFGFGYDSFSANGVRFVQWGKKVVRFVCTSQTGEMPLFIYQPRWEILKSTRRSRFGTTTKPYDFSKFWRVQCLSGQKNKHKQETGKENPAYLIG